MYMSKMQAVKNRVRAAIRSEKIIKLPRPDYHRLTVTNLVPQSVDRLDIPLQWPETPDIAFVCSHGRTGNRWMGRILNLHPDILCGVGPMIYPRAENKIDVDKLPPFDTPNRLSSVTSFQALNVDDMLATLKEYGPGFKHYIRCHAINASQLMLKMLKDSPKCKVGLVNVIRHPITRAPSYAAEWMETSGEQLHLRLKEAWDTGQHYRLYEDKIRTRFPEVDFAERVNRYFLQGVFWLMNDMNDFKVPVRHFRYEELIGHIDLLSSFLKYVLGKDFEVTQDYLDKVQAEAPANKKRASKSAVQTYNDWEPWQKYCFSQFIQDYEIDRLYHPFGYDFSFVD
jgi:hypothetical protein